MMVLLIALVGLLSMVSATVDRIIVHPDHLASYNYSLKIENHTVSAVLANGTVIHDNADPCTSKTNYQVGRDYLEADCPAPVKFMNSNGLCDVTKAIGTKHPCQVFCQVKTRYNYDLEIPWPGTWCKGPNYCMLKFNSHQYYDPPYSYPGLEDIYIQGVSGGWLSLKGSVSIYSPRATLDVRLYWNDCGYWAFLPVRKTSCGNTSMAIPNQDLKQSNCLYDKIWESYTTGDCVNQWMTFPDNHEAVVGKSVFVKVNCWGLEPLPAIYQDDAYNAAPHLSKKDLMKQLGMVG